MNWQKNFFATNAPTYDRAASTEEFIKFDSDTDIINETFKDFIINRK